MKKLLTKRKLQYLSVIFLALTISIWAYFFLLIPQAPFFWDESHHAMFGMMIERSIKQADVNAVFENTNRQIYWPFLHSWFLGVAFLIAGEQIIIARTVSLIFFFFSIILIFSLGKKLNPECGYWVGFISVLILVTSPLVLFYSTTCMIEPLGLLLTLLILNFYFWGIERKKNIHFVIAGFFGGCLYLSKYIFFIFIFFGFVIFTISLFFDRKQIFNEGDGLPSGILLKKNIPLLLGFLSVYFPWILIPPTNEKLNIIIYRIQNTSGHNLLHLEWGHRLIYYFRALLISYTFSIWVFLIFILSLIWAISLFRRFKKTRLLLFIFLSAFISMSLGTNQQDRFIYIVIPCLFLITADCIVRLINRLKKSLRYLLIIILLIFILGDIVKTPSYIKEIGNLAVGSPIYISSSLPEFPTLYGVAFYPAFLLKHRIILNSCARRPKTSDGLISVLNFIFETTGRNSSFCTLIQLNELSPFLWQWESIARNQIISTRWNPNAEYFVSIIVCKDSPYYTMPNDIHINKRNKKWIDFLEYLYKTNQIQLIREKAFTDLGIIAKIYKSIIL